MATLADDIRRIAREPRIKGSLQSKQERDPIKGFVTPFETGAFSKTTNVGATGANGEQSATGGQYDPEDPSTWGKLQPSPQWPSGSSGGDPSKNGPQTADDLVTGNAGPTLPDPSNPYSGGSLTKITGLKDCATNQTVKIHLDGQFDVPDGWDDPESPPKYSGFIQGVMWQKDVGVAISSQNHYSSIGEAVDALIQYAENLYSNQYGAASATADTGQVVDSGPPGYVNGLRYTVAVTLHITYYSTYSWSWQTMDQSHYVYGFECSNIDFSTPSCGITEPPTKPGAQWPTTGGYQLAFRDGKFTASKYDSEAPSSASEPRSVLNLCTTGGKFVTIRAASNGGTMMYETSTQGGAPQGTMRVYNADGTMRFAGDATNTNIQSQLPR